MAGRDGDHVTVEGSAQIEQPDTVAVVEMAEVKLRKRNIGSNCETLACEPSQEGLGAAEECDEAIPKNEDIVLDTSAKGIAAVRGSPRRDEVILEVGVCSNSSENVLSGLSDEGCAVSGEGGSGIVQGLDFIRAAGVVDEGSGIGKCCSSDDVDIGVGRNPNTSSVLEVPSNVVGSPPSFSNMGKGLLVKRRGMKVSKSIDNHEGEAEPVASTGECFYSGP